MAHAMVQATPMQSHTGDGIWSCPQTVAIAPAPRLANPTELAAARTLGSRGRDLWPGPLAGIVAGGGS